MITLQFAQAVRRYCRDDITVTEIAERMQCDEAAVMAALGMLGLPVPGERHAAPERPAIDVDQLPKKWQDHYGRE